MYDSGGKTAFIIGSNILKDSISMRVTDAVRVWRVLTAALSQKRYRDRNQ